MDNWPCNGNFLATFGTLKSYVCRPRSLSNRFQQQPTVHILPVLVFGPTRFYDLNHIGSVNMLENTPGQGSPKQSVSPSAKTSFLLLVGKGAVKNTVYPLCGPRLSKNKFYL